MKEDAVTVELRDYIQSMRSWIADHANPSLDGSSSRIIEEWQSEVTAAESLLERRAELPIALLGPAQQGKSSLINALLGHKILAVGGSIGACTSVVTSIHYRDKDGFRAEIEFLSFADWKRELTDIQATLATENSEDDSTEDIEELQTAKETASEKVKAVYRADSGEDFDFALLDEATLGLPADIASRMKSGHPLVLEENSALTLRNQVKRYLVGRGQHDDAYYWPIISRVKIFGRFDLLSNGLALVDLPGLNDPNPAREQVTKRYLSESRHIWLVCNSQVGIDRVFDNLLRENGFLFRLFLEGRLDCFSVVATRADVINIEAVLEQMGIAPEEFDGDVSRPLAYRRNEIEKHVGNHLEAIARGIVERAADGEHQSAFIEKVRRIPVFSVGTLAYLHATGAEPLYQGMRLDLDATHIPLLAEHIRSVTLEFSYRQQVEAAHRRLQMLHDRIHRFFLSRIRALEESDETARQQWQQFRTVSLKAVEDGQGRAADLVKCSHASLKERCRSFSEKLAELDARAVRSLENVMSSWEGINWRTLQAAMKRGGEWFSPSQGREFNFNRDVARAFLDLIPLVWDDFFGNHLSSLVASQVGESNGIVREAAQAINGSLAMLTHQHPEIVETMEGTLVAAAESARLQTAQVQADVTAQIQRTRQELASGLFGTASSFMQDAYQRAAADPGGTGIKRRMLDIIQNQARSRASDLFIGMRKELAEGVAVLQAAMHPQLDRLAAYSTGLLDQFAQNISRDQSLSPEVRERARCAMDALPHLDAGASVLSRSPQMGVVGL